MNKKIILKMFAMMFRGYDAVAIDLRKGIITSIHANVEKNRVSELDIAGTKTHIDMLKEYLNIKADIQFIGIDLKQKTFEIKDVNNQIHNV